MKLRKILPLSPVAVGCVASAGCWKDPAEVALPAVPEQAIADVTIFIR